jgi:hypothetical protein
MRYEDNTSFGNYLMVEDIDRYLEDLGSKLEALECSDEYIAKMKTAKRSRYLKWVEDGKPTPKWAGLSI